MGSMFEASLNRDGPFSSESCSPHEMHRRSRTISVNAEVGAYWREGGLSSAKCIKCARAFHMLPGIQNLPLRLEAVTGDTD